MRRLSADDRAVLKRAAKLGRGSDTLLVHINMKEAELLKKLGGDAKINPRTGLKEFDPGGGADSGNGDGGAGDSGGNGGGNAGGAGLGGFGAGGTDTSASGLNAAAEAAANSASANNTGGSLGTGDPGNAAHAAEVNASPASNAPGNTAGTGQNVEANGKTVAENQPGFFGNALAGLLSSFGINTTNQPGLGLTPGVNTNAVSTALGAIPGATGLGLGLSATGLGNKLGQAIGLDNPERGFFGSLADSVRGTTPDNAADFFGNQGDQGPSANSNAGSSAGGANAGSNTAGSGDRGNGGGGNFDGTFFPTPMTGNPQQSEISPTGTPMPLAPRTPGSTPPLGAVPPPTPFSPQMLASFMPPNVSPIFRGGPAPPAFHNVPAGNDWWTQFAQNFAGSPWGGVPQRAMPRFAA